MLRKFSQGNKGTRGPPCRTAWARPQRGEWRGNRSGPLAGGWGACVALWWTHTQWESGNLSLRILSSGKYILYLKGKETYVGVLLKIFFKCSEGIFGFCREYEKK